LSLCFPFLFGGLGLVVLGIGGNGADFRDIFGDHLWNRVDGWMETHDAVPKHQKSSEGSLILIQIPVVFLSLSL